MVATVTNSKSRINLKSVLKTKNLAKETWLGDTGASCHVTASSHLMTRKTDHGEEVITCSEEKEKVLTSGNLQLKGGELDNQQGWTMTLEKVRICENITSNIMSIGSLMRDGTSTIVANKEKMTIVYKGSILEFNRAADGLFYLEASRVPAKETSSVYATTTKKKKDGDQKYVTVMNRMEAHEKWGHQSRDILDKIANYLNIKLQGKMDNCGGCGRVKARTLAVTKTCNVKGTKKGERNFIDATGPFPETLGGKNKYYMVAVDDFTDMTWVHFAKKKSEMVKVVKTLITLLKGKNIDIGYIRCDNAGEHQENLKALCLGVTNEYTAPGTPKQNSRAERKIAVL